MRIRLVREEATELSRLYQLAGATPTAAQWTEEAYLTLASSAERKAWVAEAAASEGGGDGLAGFLVARGIGAEWELENLAVAEDRRRHGIATALLEAFLGHAREHGGTAVFLEVRESNASAVAFYQSRGFKQAGIRRLYYSEPEEDALVLKLKLD